MNPSEEIRRLYQDLPDGEHWWVNNLEEWDVPHNKIYMDPTDFPYFRDALIWKAVNEGDIEQY